MSDNQQGHYMWLDNQEQNEEIPAWKALDNVIRKWAVLSQFENDQDGYAKMKEYYA